MIELRGVTKQYLYGARVLGALDLTVNDGEILAVLGEEGSGKTTLLKCIAGVTDCEGERLVDGAPIAKKPNNLQFVFDDLALFERRTGFYNLAYPLKIRGMGKDEIKEAVESAALKAMGSTACLYERVNKLPLVDVKRLAIARLLLRDARNVIIDDVTAGLPAAEAAELWGQLVPILVEKAKAGATIIYSTSSLEEAASISNRIVVMFGGEVKQIGSFDAIYNNPANIWAAQAVDKYYHIEFADLTAEGDKLYAVLDNEFKADISHLRSGVIEKYIGKRVFAGWHGDEFCDEGRTASVQYVVRDGNRYVHFAEGCKVVLKEEKKEVCVMPRADKVSLFDVNNENSILK